MSGLYQSKGRNNNNSKWDRDDKATCKLLLSSNSDRARGKKPRQGRVLLPEHRPSLLQHRQQDKRKHARSSSSSCRYHRSDGSKEKKHQSLKYHEHEIQKHERASNRKYADGTRQGQEQDDRHTSKKRKAHLHSPLHHRQRRPNNKDDHSHAHNQDYEIKERNPINHTLRTRSRSNPLLRRKRRQSMENSRWSRDSHSTTTSISVFHQKGVKIWKRRRSQDSKALHMQRSEQLRHKQRYHGYQATTTSSASSSCAYFERSRHHSRRSLESRPSSYSYSMCNKYDFKSRRAREQNEDTISSRRRTRTETKPNRSSKNNKKKTSGKSSRHRYTHSGHRKSGFSARRKRRSTSTSSSSSSDIYRDLSQNTAKENKIGRRNHRRRRTKSVDSNNNNNRARKRRGFAKSNTRYYNSSTSSDLSSQRQRKRQRKRRNNNSSNGLLHEEQPLQHHHPNSINNAVVSDEELENVRSASRSTNSSDWEDHHPRDDTVGHYQSGPGSLISDRYEIVRDMGIGTFGRVVGCVDRRSRHHEEVAIKVVRDVKRYYESAQIEADILRHVNSRSDERGTTLCVQMLDHFHILEGRHYCLVFESLGLSLYDFLKKYDFQPFPLYCIQDFSQQLLSALEFLHSFHLIHTDLKPENILLVSSYVKMYDNNNNIVIVPASTRIKVIDFGGATYDDEQKSSVINTRQYRAPEVILELPWSFPSDLWSLGCILAELYTGNLLFATHDNYEHLALIERAIGPFPRYMLDESISSLTKKVFDSHGLFCGRSLSPSSQTHVEQMLPLDGLFVNESDNSSGLPQLLKQLLVIDPYRRATASEALKFLFPKRSQVKKS